jgi:tetratricopeptide (TPR) repeat protein
MHTGQYEMAISMYNAAIGIDAKSGPAYFGLGSVYVLQKNPAMARTQYEKLVLIDKALADKLLAKLQP